LLAESYFREKRYDDALPLYLTLESEYAQSLLTIDGQLASEGRGGRYATVLQNLREIYLITGRRADAAAFNEKLMALFPQLGQHEAEVAKSVSKVHMDEVNLGKGELQAGKARSAWVIVIIVVNIIVLGMLIAVLLLRRYRRKG
jgi:tetratricopeptide (TPR) repeat protein